MDFKKEHQISKKHIRLIHVFIWLFALFGNLAFPLLRREYSPQFLVSTIIGFLYLMFIFYLYYLLLTPLFLNKKNLLLFFCLSFISVLIMPFFGYTLLFISRAFFDGTFHDFYRGYSVKMHMSGFYPVLTAAVFGSFFRVIIDWFTAINQKVELDKQKLAAELDLLKSKLNPHFLFNTLNNIDALIHHNPEEASAALIKLSEIMRYLTYETSSEFVELRKEVEYIRNFIELYRMRIKSPEDIRFEIAGDLNLMVSPALFVPLIENAFKFASFRNKKPCVDIQINAGKGTIVFEISNIFEINSNIPETIHSGYGIINLRKRLDLVYPGRHLLMINQTDSQYNVKLTIYTNAN